MYRLVRNFSIASALAIMVVSAIVYLVMQAMLRDEMIYDTEKSNVSLIKTISNTMIGNISDYLLIEHERDFSTLHQSSGFQHLDRELRKAVSGTGIYKIKIYAPNGRVVYSTDLAQIGERSLTKEGFSAAISGKIVSELVYRDTMNTFEGVVEKTNLVTSYMPLVIGDKIIGVFEVYRNVTTDLKRIATASRNFAVVVGAIFLTLFGVLFVFISRADSIIRRQYDKTRSEIQVRINAEAALRESESRLQDFTASASEWAWETDANHRFVYMSDRVFDAIGLRASDIIGKSRVELQSTLSTVDHQSWAKHMAMLDGHLPFRGFTYAAEVNGKEVYIRANGVPFFDDDGTFAGYRGTGNNVTQEIEAERELERSEQKFSLAFHASPALVVISGLESGIHYDVNERWCEILGIAREDAIGKTAYEMNLWKSSAARESFTEALRKNGSVRGVEIQLVTSSNEPRDFLVDAEILKFEGEDRMMMVAQDITERKRMVDDLRASHDELERRVNERTRDLRNAMESAEMASRTKSEFLANMSHELRTPLNAIIGFSDIIKHEMFGKIDNASYVEYATHIKESGEHLLSLISDILDVSAIEAGKLDLSDEEFSVDGVIEASIRLVVERARAHDIALTGNAVSDDGGTTHLSLRGDERRVKQILLNLLSNAIKFTPPGGTVSIATRIISDGRLALSVTDTGIGIAKADIPKVLSPFGQVESGLSRQHEGTGLGLHLTRNLAELHGGRLSIASKVGYGTRVTVTFPANRVQVISPATPADAVQEDNQLKIV